MGQTITTQTSQQAPLKGSHMQVKAEGVGSSGDCGVSTALWDVRWESQL
jgi:hypothetical protein